MLLLHEFYQKYANVPLEKRLEVLDRMSTQEMTLQDIYNRLHDLDDMIHPLEKERKELLDFAERFIEKEEVIPED